MDDKTHRDFVGNSAQLEYHNQPYQNDPSQYYADEDDHYHTHQRHLPPFYDKQDENNFGYQLLPPKPSTYVGYPYEIKEDNQLPAKQYERKSVKEPKNQQQIPALQSSNNHPFYNETFQQNNYLSQKYEQNNYEFEDQSFQSSYNNAQKFIQPSLNGQINESTDYYQQQKTLNNYCHVTYSCYESNEYQHDEIDNNYHHRNLTTYHQSADPPTIFSSQHSSIVPPIPPVRISSLKQSSQKYNHEEYFENYHSGLNHATIEKLSSDGLKNDGQQSIYKKPVISPSFSFSNSNDSGFIDTTAAFVAANVKDNSPPRKMNNCEKQITQKQQKDETPAFHKYFKVDSQPHNLPKKSLHPKVVFESDKNNKNNNYHGKYRDEKYAFATSFSGNSTRRGGFSCTVNDHLKIYPSPKNNRNNKQSTITDNNNSQQLDASSKNSNSGVENKVQNKNTVFENSDVEIKVNG
uniref:Uncharacterized protein n=1 Tax=Panagrolaimus sp. ES5 TaxID=591445 RepID=A0AC34EZB9_9BILA